MRKYIFFTCAIQPMGGAQNYVRSKIKFLKKNGWKVYVIYSGAGTEMCQFQELNEYIEGGFPVIYKNPRYIYGSLEFYLAIYKMLCYVEYMKGQECEYWIESHHDYDSIWAEILAEILQAKHICLLTQENYFAKGMNYQEYINYFEFKLEQNELLGITKESIHNLFCGYKNIEISDKYSFWALAYENVDDISCKIIENLPDCDYTIGYMGRCEKEYFSIIVDNIGLFGSKYKNKRILFLVMGSAGNRELNKLDELKEYSNITVKYLGTFNPIPKSFFDKVDVMIAGAGCAIISYLQNTMTIVPHALNLQPIGILGYTTDETIYGKTRGQYIDWIESILIEKKYINLQRKKLFVDKNADMAFEEALNKVKNENGVKNYYNFEFEIHDECVRNANNYVSVNDFLCFLSSNEKVRNVFFEYIKNSGYNSIGLYGFGKIGKRIKEVLPELQFRYIFDANVIDSNNSVVYPETNLLYELELLILSPIGLDNEIKNDLENLNYKGKVISFYQYSLEFIKYLLRENKY